MSIIRVAIPVKKGKRKFYLAKGRPWSLVEHVLLAALVSRPRNVEDLSKDASLPRRLVLEALIRLMRAGWVELVQEPKEVIFNASDAGKSVVDNEELPQVSKNISRWMNFVIDGITGTVYRSRELPFIERHIVADRSKRECLVWLEPRVINTSDEAAGILSALFDDDEKFLGVEISSERLVDRFAVVTVRNGKVEGLPPRAPQELTNIILRAAQDAPKQPEGENSPSIHPGPLPQINERSLPRVIQGSFNPQDLILGGRQHKEAFHEAINRAKSRIILHSTFISNDRFMEVWQLLKNAAQRGVLIDILWGEDENKTESTSTKIAIKKIRSQIESAGLSDTFRVNAFSTRSHSKILISDDSKNKLHAVVGSCNWLSSQFKNYEVSVRLSDPNVVAAVLEQVAELTKGSQGHWTSLTSEIARLSATAKSQKAVHGLKANISLVLGPQHSQFVRQARDHAKKRMFVASHQLGEATRPAVVVPAITAVKDRGLDVTVYYGVQTKSFRNDDVASITRAAGQEGVDIRPVIEPRLHAKVLAWDDDNLLVTSQNWLSADPNESNIRSEIGIFIQSSGVSKIFMENFDVFRNHL
jgi:cardiolipin synthase A/B